MKICIDPGHGGADSGAVNGGLIEKDMTLVTAKALSVFLRRHGHQTLLTHTGALSEKTKLDLSARCLTANSWGAELLISCHYNAGGGDRAEIIRSAYRFTEQSEKLGTAILASLEPLGQNSGRIIVKKNAAENNDYFGIIRLSGCPALIIEPCFIDHAHDCTLADTPAKQKSVGVAIGRGILRWIGQAEDASLLDNTPAPWAADAVKKAAAQNLLRGDDMGNLALHAPLDLERLLVLFDRTGLLDQA